MSFSDPPSLNELLNAVMDGDERAKRILYEEFKSLFHTFARRYLWKGCQRPEVHSLEVENLAWAKIFLKIGELRDHDSLILWAKTIIEHEAANHLRQCINHQHKEQNEVPIEELRELPRGQISDDATVIMNALLAREILKIAYEISPQFHRILLLHAEGWRLPEIAKKMGEPYQQMHSHFYRNLRKLRLLLKGKKK